MPYYQAVELLSDSQVRIGWDASVDLQGDALTYNVKIATSPRFEAAFVVKEQTLSQTELLLAKSLLPNGVYYLKVTAKDSKGNIQNAFDSTTVADKNYFGVYAFEVKAGEVVAL